MSFSIFFLLPGHLKATGSRKPARIPAYSSLLAISFSSRICFHICQIGGIIDPAACSQGQCSREVL